MRILLSLIFFVFLSFPILSQTVGNLSWESIDDFKAEESNIIKNIVWLENNPIATDQNDTKAISQYIISWLSSTPYLEVVLDGVFLESLLNSKKFKYAEKFKVTYLFGKSLYLIEHQDEPDEVKASTRGVEGMVLVYKELKRLDPSLRNGVLEKYARLSQKEKLESYVRARLSEPESSVVLPY
ncbi:MAG: hypothetical protein KDC58_10075 [Cyclobacteriaceae bacterium]|nr:hypothetical protein [Cyclobacteriaceae bacterium]